MFPGLEHRLWLPPVVHVFSLAGDVCRFLFATSVFLFREGLQKVMDVMWVQAGSLLLMLLVILFCLNYFC